MSFLSLAFLAALPLAAAPILLHLFDRRRNVVIEWGAMQFLVEAAARRTSARRVMQRLLLLLRVLALACLVLALARPLAPGEWFASDDRSETVIVLDNSMSMLRSDGERAQFRAAVDKASEVLDAIEPGHFARVLMTSPYPVWVTPTSVRMGGGTQTELIGQLRSLRPTQGGSQLLAGLFTALQAEIEPTAQRRRIVVVTDGQQVDWAVDDAAGWERFREAWQAATVATQLDVLTLDAPQGPADNVAVNRVHARRTVVGIDQPFTASAEVQNHGGGTSWAIAARWSVAGETLAENPLPALEPGAVHEAVWTHSFPEAGVFAVSCQIDAEDILAADNGATVIVEVVDQTPVLVVESAPGQEEHQRDAFFVEAALGWMNGEPGDAPGVFAPTLVAPDEIHQVELRSYSAVVVPNLIALEEDAVRRLQTYVASGGGLWIALGPRTDIDGFNHRLFADGQGLAPLAIERIVDEVADDGKATRIRPFDKEHAATAALADDQRLDTGEIAITRRFQFIPPPQGEEPALLLGLTNGEPLAVEKSFGLGRVIVQAVPLRLQWSDLARSQAFVVMVQDWLSYLSQPRATRHNLAPGEPISVRLTAADAREATLRTPEGEEFELTADTGAAADEVVFRSSRTIAPGDYALEISLSGDPIPFHVHRDPQESNLAPLTAENHRLLDEIAALENGAVGATGVARANTPLWPLLWVLLLALMGGELAMSGLISRQRFGNAPIAETAEQSGEHESKLSPIAATRFPASPGRRSHFSRTRP